MEPSSLTMTGPINSGKRSSPQPKEGKLNPPNKTKKLLVKMIYTALAVGSALWSGQRLMVDEVRAQYTNTPQMDQALQRLEREATHKAKVKAARNKTVKVTVNNVYY